MSQQDPGPTAVTVSDVQQLLKKKDEIEAQIKAYYAVLEDQKGVGMNEPLVDVEGYPRADVDIYQVRTARHNIICLQNDHKALMHQVEQALHQLHAREKEKRERDEAEAQVEARSQSQALPQPFARVNAVTPGSPASISGLQVDDEIVEFGSVNTRNFQSLQNIVTVLQHSEGLQYTPFAKMTSSSKSPNDLKSQRPFKPGLNTFLSPNKLERGKLNLKAAVPTAEVLTAGSQLQFGNVTS